MHIGMIILLGIAVNLDNLCLGLAFGVAKKHIPWYHNLIIALVIPVYISFNTMIIPNVAKPKIYKFIRKLDL